MIDYDMVMRSLEYCAGKDGCWNDEGECPWTMECMKGGKSLDDYALKVMNEMYQQIQDTKSCLLCENNDKCSSSAEFDTYEYKMFAGCRGSLKLNWKWKGVRFDDD